MFIDEARDTKCTKRVAQFEWSYEIANFVAPTHTYCSCFYRALKLVPVSLFFRFFKTPYRVSFCFLFFSISHALYPFLLFRYPLYFARVDGSQFQAPFVSRTRFLVFSRSFTFNTFYYFQFKILSLHPFFFYFKTLSIAPVSLFLQDDLYCTRFSIFSKSLLL